LLSREENKPPIIYVLSDFLRGSNDINGEICELPEWGFDSGALTDREGFSISNLIVLGRELLLFIYF
jgi:hypothetical protein